MMKKTLFSLCLLSFALMTYAQSDAAPKPSTDVAPAKPRYTGTDFFNALDLPIVFGATYTPTGIQTAGFNTTMCLEWRWHKTYSWYVPITIDTHNADYKDLHLEGSNIISGTVWYNDINIGVGYRIPLVKDIRDFYANPYANKLDFFLCAQPGVTNPSVKNITAFSVDADGNIQNATTEDIPFTLVPSLKLTAGIEWFVDPKLCLFAQAAYVQHLTPTLIEKAAIEQGKAHGPAGPLMFSIGLSTFFE